MKNIKFKKEINELKGTLRKIEEGKEQARLEHVKQIEKRSEEQSERLVAALRKSNKNLLGGLQGFDSVGIHKCNVGIQSIFTYF